MRGDSKCVALSAWHLRADSFRFACFGRLRFVLRSRILFRGFRVLVFGLPGFLKNFLGVFLPGFLGGCRSFPGIADAPAQD